MIGKNTPSVRSELQLVKQMMNWFWETVVLDQANTCSGKGPAAPDWEFGGCSLGFEMLGKWKKRELQEYGKKNEDFDDSKFISQKQKKKRP
jgi:hypothetical protein